MNYNDMVLDFLDSCSDRNCTEDQLDLFVDCPPLMRQFTVAQRIQIARQYGYMQALAASEGNAKLAATAA